jgi:VCBS repeat protein/ASPIC/UnbV protein
MKSWIPALALACAMAAGASAQRGSGSRAMAARLAVIADDFESVNLEQAAGMVFGTNQPHLIPVLRQRAAAAREPMERYSLRVRLAAQLLQAGFSKEALQELDSLQTAIKEMPAALATPAQKGEELARLQSAIGIAALRMGEQENCLLNHRATSCLFPIDRGGVHTLQGGARRAIDAFARRLTATPKNPAAMWLLNLAYMTVGEHPAHVPRQWLIPPELFRSEYDIKRFPDVSMANGVDTIGLAGGSIIEDFDADGYPDIVASSWGVRDQLRFFRNTGKGGFEDRTREAGLTGQVGGININHADYNNDGRPDILVIRGGWLREAGRHPNSLLRNNGDGTFDDVTEEAGLLSFHPTHTTAWGDFNNDGFLDLFVGNEDWGTNTHPVQLYQNNGNGTFTDRARELGFGVLGVVKGSAWGDYNNDGWPDLYVSRFGRPNLLFRNNRGRFTDVTSAAGVAEPVNSFPTWFFDYDNDGWLDLFVGGFDESGLDAVLAVYRGGKQPQGTPRLYRNNRDGTFEDVTVRARLDRVLLAMGANFGDLDNDGYLDIYVGTGAPDLNTLVPNRMFRNAGGRVFQDVTTSGGFGHLQKGHGVSFGDLDNDGDQDIYEVIGGWFTGDTYQNVLFENPGHGNHWITIALEGTRTNRTGVGARVKVRVRSARGARDIYATGSTGGSFGDSTLQQEIGLGDATAIESIEVRWPVSGATQVFRDVGMDQFVRIREADPTIHPLSRRIASLASMP